MSTTVARTRMPADPKDHARHIAEAVESAWYHAHGGSQIETPLAVTAALALAGAGGNPSWRLPEVLPQLSPQRFSEVIDRLWLEWSITRPDLVPAAKFLWARTGSTDATLVRAIHAAGMAALRAGVWEFGADEHRRHTVDLLGTGLQAMRSRKASQSRGQFLTPECVAELLGRMVGMAEGRSLMEPCAGTGRMLLGAACAMRDAGLDPTTVTWWANDIDPLAAALCAVNTHLWDLGPRVVIGCGDGLLTDWTTQALASRQAAIDELQAIFRVARMEIAFRQLLNLPTEPDPLRLEVARLFPKQPPAHSETFDAAAAYRQPRLF